MLSVIDSQVLLVTSSMCHQRMFMRTVKVLFFSVLPGDVRTQRDVSSFTTRACNVYSRLGDHTKIMFKNQSSVASVTVKYSLTRLYGPPCIFTRT